jgi:hypothetical protein
MHSSLHLLFQVATQDPGSSSAVSQLGRWLPAGPISAASPEGAMAEEEVRLLHSIHNLVAQCEVGSWEKGEVSEPAALYTQPSCSV